MDEQLARALVIALLTVIAFSLSVKAVMKWYETK